MAKRTVSGVAIIPEGKPKGGHWSQRLVSSMQDPQYIVDENDDVVVIKDKYPKAKYHYLVVSKADITGIHKLSADHMDLLKKMESTGKAVAEKHKGVHFKLGFHAIPSMQRLHMHVISQDMMSPSLKTKKHWNSFTTDFFTASTDLIKELKKNGFIAKLSASEYKSFMDSPLKCHKCKKLFTNMPNLKKHIEPHDTDSIS